MLVDYTDPIEYAEEVMRLHRQDGLSVGYSHFLHLASLIHKDRKVRQDAMLQSFGLSGAGEERLA